MYTGREYDRWLKLYYNRARYYNPQLARFISRDPIDIADDVNLYSYVGNNSIKYVDLMGTEKKWIKENEWNAWYFDNASWINSEEWFDLWHAALYFINDWEEYLVSFYPTNDGSIKDTSWLFASGVNWNLNWWIYNKIDFKKMLYKSEYKWWYSSIEFWINNIDNAKVVDWYNEEYINIPEYTTFTNNCSDEVRKALVAWWFLDNRWIIPLTLTTHLDTPMKLRKEIIYNLK